ncbi:tyrosine-protein phosphatase [Parasphingorhabdus sp.]|uniref:tyrosine-protein phosphatase n=1 Tax=Parasphingorhabdus sp. TaxID=2709688 RepID=UPI003BB2031D
MSEPVTSLNFRDLGGIAAETGKIRSGLLFRSEGPRNFCDRHFEELRNFGIHSIIDLRSVDERKEIPHAWHSPECTLLELEVDADLRVFGDEGRERLQRGSDPAIAVDTMKETYRSIPGSLTRHWARITGVMSGGSMPMLINCTAGKDRTGVAIALLLELVGVPRHEIMKDYLRSNVFGQNMHRTDTVRDGFMTSYGFVPSDGQIEALIGVQSDYLQSAWSEVDKRWGGLDSYFDDAGIGPNLRNEILGMLVERY